jgi:hypothetical protein
MANGFAAFIIRRSITAVIVLGIVITITAVFIYSGTCARINAIRAEIRQQILDEIAARGIEFPSARAMELYVQQRMQEELSKRGLDICG